MNIHVTKFDNCTREILKNLVAEDSCDSESDAVMQSKITDGQNKFKKIPKHEADTP